MTAANNSSNSSDEQVARLAEQNSYADPTEPPTPVATDGFFWKLVDTVGPWAAIAAAGLAAVALLVGWLGGESFAWISFLYLPITLLLLLYIPYLFRRRQQEKMVAYLVRQQEQEKARLEVARIVLEQSQQAQKKEKEKNS